MSESFRLAFRNLARNKRRNAATGFSVALGFAALLALGGYLNRVESFYRVYTIFGDRTGHIMLYKKDGLTYFSSDPEKYSLSPEVQSAIVGVLEQNTKIDFFGGQLTGSGLIGNGCKTLPFLGVGIEPAIEKRLRTHQEVVRWMPQLREFQKGGGLWEYPEDLGAIALSTGLVRLLDKPNVYDDFSDGARQLVIVDCMAEDAKDKIAADANVQLVAGSWSGMMSAIDGEVVAHYSTGVTDTNNTALLTTLSHFQELYQTSHVSSYAIWLKDLDDLDEVFHQLQDSLAGLDLDIYRWSDETLSPLYSGTLDFLWTMVGFIASVLGLIIVFSVLNAATMTIIERSQEIGMMRSLGYTQKQVRFLFLKEMMVLTIISLVIGGVIGLLGIYGVNHGNIYFNPPGIAGRVQLMIDPDLTTAIWSVVFIFVVTMLATWFAIKNVTQQKVAVLLSGVNR